MISKTLYSSASEEWATPQDLFDGLNDEFGFTLDPCATPENAKCIKYFTKRDDGLTKDWGTAIVFCNPPYGRGIESWVQKCAEHAKRGGASLLC